MRKDGGRLSDKRDCDPIALLVEGSNVIFGNGCKYVIFISHTNTDKPVVEPAALKLREIFGEESVFYDSWSIQPGEDIIEKMNDGLTDPKFVFFFVSEESLKSKMVSLEWQNALLKATKGQCKIIPVRVDGSPMPALLSQNLNSGKTFPESGRTGRVEGTCELVVPRTPFIVPYRVKGEVIEILGVHHTARRWPKAV